MTVNVAVDAAGIDPDAGVTLKNFGVFDPLAGKEIAVEVKFVMLKFCALRVDPGGPMNSNPVGETIGGAAVPAGTICRTTAIETGG